MFSALKPLSALPSYSSVSLVRHCKLNIVLAIACVASVCVALANKSRIAFRSVVHYSVHRVVNLNMTEAVQRCSEKWRANREYRSETTVKSKKTQA
jgi:hypothetical protein